MLIKNQDGEHAATRQNMFQHVATHLEMFFGDNKEAIGKAVDERIGGQATTGDALAYLDFPYDHHRRLRTNDARKRANREPKRRGCVVQVFPSEGR